jgi:chromosome partitioning protein
MSHVITIAQQKGGAGKTTLAAHLAVNWCLEGKKVALVDIDPQGSLTRWYEVRREKYGNTAFHPEVRTVTGWRVSNEVSRLQDENDIVIIDSPPHTQSEAKIAIRSASLVIIPMQPSPMDLWATEPTIKLAKDENVPVLLVLNRVPPRTLLTDNIKKLVRKFDVDIAKSIMGNRVALASSFLQGRGIGETHRGTIASDEITALGKEISALLKKAEKKAA